jgi:hypothetical protein
LRWRLVFLYWLLWYVPLVNPYLLHANSFIGTEEANQLEMDDCIGYNCSNRYRGVFYPPYSILLHSDIPFLLTSRGRFLLSMGNILWFLKSVL